MGSRGGMWELQWNRLEVKRMGSLPLLELAGQQCLLICKMRRVAPLWLAQNIK